MLDTIEQHPAALDRITSIANQVANAVPGGDALVKELIALSQEVLRAGQAPQPVETAPRDAGRKLLLYCPEQGGWQVGEWTGERWALTWTWDLLTPTHWIQAPENLSP
jgi:hypothetical protein